MPGAVHVELAVVVHGERLLDTTRQEAQGHEPFGEDAPGGVVDGIVALARAGRLDGRDLRAEHELVDPPLRRGEASRSPGRCA